MEPIFASKADHIRFLLTEGHTVREIALRARANPKYVYAVRGRDSSARSIHGRLDQIARDVIELQLSLTDLKEQLREWLGIPGIIQRRLAEIADRDSQKRLHSSGIP